MNGATYAEHVQHIPRAVRRYATEFQRLTRPNEPGIYILMSQGTPIYVGQSGCFLRRFGGHKFIHECDEILFLPTPWSELDEREREFIRLLRPHFNSAFGRVGAKPVTKAFENRVELPIPGDLP